MRLRRLQSSRPAKKASARVTVRSFAFATALSALSIKQGQNKKQENGIQICVCHFFCVILQRKIVEHEEDVIICRFVRVDDAGGAETE